VRRSLGALIDVKIDIDPNLPIVMVDAHQLELAILNLALNARDAMPAGGELTISGRFEIILQPTAELPSGDYACITITDRGVGMDAETLKRATEPFFTTKGIGKGTGLGLSMVQGLMVQSGGAMQINSYVGAGTSIQLWLPVAGDVAENVSGTVTFETSSNVSSRHILLVDDDPLVLSTAAAMLEDLGHVVATADSGTNAMSLVHTEQQIDLLIADYAMPGMNGLELAELAGRQRPQLPIIIASGFSDEAAVESGMLHRLTKPYSQDQLASCIEKATGSAQAFPVVSLMTEQETER
jgi:CheY-like chemotaxis protein